MNTLTKMALGFMGRLRPKPGKNGATEVIALPPPESQGSMPLMDALHQRHSTREFRTDPLPPQVLSNLLWSAFGINRPDSGGRTAPSAINAQEIDVYAAMASGLYRYDPEAHALNLISPEDVRRVTGYQEFVDLAPVDLVYVADWARMKMTPAAQRQVLSAAGAGAIAENVYLYCASAGLAAVVRALIDREALARAVGLTADQHIVLAQTVGYPKSSGD